MRLVFFNQQLANFKAFTGRHTFEWDSPGVTFIRGENQLDKELTSNGASKSSLFDSWCWCLFGRTPAGLRNPDVVPWYAATGQTEVTQHIQINGKQHSVCRQINPNRLLFDGEDVDQDKLNAKLGLNFALATNTILLAQDRPLFFDLTPEKKMELFSDTLQLNRWDDRASLAGKRQVEAEEKAEEFRLQQSELRGSLSEVEALLAEAKEAAEAWAAKVRKEKRVSVQQTAVLQRKLEAAEVQLGDAQLKEDGAATELVALRREAAKLVEDSRAATRAFAKAESEVEAVTRQVTTFQGELADLRQRKTCPTCGQPIKTGNLAKHKGELEAQLTTAKAKVASGIPRKVRAALEFFQKRGEETTRYIAAFEAKEESAGASLARLRPEVEALRARLQEVRRGAGEGQAQRNPYQDQIRGLQARLADLKDRLAGVGKDLSLVLQRAEQYRAWVRGFKDVKLQLVDEVLAELEIVTNGMLEDVGLARWSVRYDIEKETKSGTVKRALHAEIRSPDSKGFVKWEAWSGGERQRLKLVGALALSDVLLAKAGVETNLEILDEPALYWSADGVHDLCAFLADRARQTKRSIFFVEHSAAESAYFSQVVTVVKDKQGAYIVRN